MGTGCAGDPYSLACAAGLDGEGIAPNKIAPVPIFQLQRAVEGVLEMLDDWPRARGTERDGHHVDPHLAVLEPVPTNIGGGQFGDPPLLLWTDGFGGMTVGGVGP